ncbi:putative transferase caf17 [Diplonema papillatum]|nr:putative transferase caf17 [Diplonema papillatum]|eukprot:gene7126-10982_t
MKRIGAARRFFSMPSMVLDSDRTLLEVRGKDAGAMLQGLATNDVRLLGEGLVPDSDTQRRATIYTGFLSSKGRVIADGFLYHENDECIRVDLHADVRDIVKRHLTLHKFHSVVEIVHDDEHCVVVCDSSLPADQIGSLAGSLDTDCSDPRLSMVETPFPVLKRSFAFKQEALAPSAKFAHSGDIAASIYMVYRMLAGLPEGPSEMQPQVALPLESNLDFMSGVSFGKGCYIGQELTARTHHRGVTRKRLLPVVLTRSGAAVDLGGLLARFVAEPRALTVTKYEGSFGALAVKEGGASAGFLRASVQVTDDVALGIAQLKLEHVAWDEPTLALTADSALYVTPLPPQWWPED